MRVTVGACFVLANGGVGLILAGYGLAGVVAFAAALALGKAADRMRVARSEP